MADTAVLDAILAKLQAAGWQERESVKDELLAYMRAHKTDALVTHLEGARKSLPLELRWEIDEVIEAITPPPAPPPEEEPKPEEKGDGRLRMSDLKEVYADPRGLVLYTDKTGKRWFASQPDPYTGQPSLMEIPPTQIEQVKAQLRGSPYWRLGSGLGA